MTEGEPRSARQHLTSEEKTKEPGTVKRAQGERSLGNGDKNLKRVLQRGGEQVGGWSEGRKDAGVSSRGGDFPKRRKRSPSGTFKEKKSAQGFLAVIASTRNSPFG